jgi:excisionase family DNA binding protein
VSGSGERGSGKAAAIRLAIHRPSADVEPERLAYSVNEAATVLGIARETVYELIRSGQLRSRKAGNRRIVGRHHLLEFLDGDGSLADRSASWAAPPNRSSRASAPFSKIGYMKLRVCDAELGGFAGANPMYASRRSGRWRLA